MLYHWHELDPETTAPQQTFHRGPADVPNIQYHAATSIAHANGAPFRLSAPGLNLIAANDAKIDAVARRLRLAGLGIIGDPEHRAEPGDYSLIRRTARLCGSVVKFIAGHLLNLISSTVQKRGQHVSSCSHTMVSNDTDDQAVKRDDAERQRFNASIR